MPGFVAWLFVGFLRFPFPTGGLEPLQALGSEAAVLVLVYVDEEVRDRKRRPEVLSAQGLAKETFGLSNLLTWE